MKSINSRLKPSKSNKKPNLVRRMYAMTMEGKLAANQPEPASQKGSTEQDERKMARNLIVLVAFHVVAISMWLIYESRQSDVPKAVVAVSGQPVRLGPNEISHNVQRGETYAQIAAHYGLSESDMRSANNNVALSAGLQLRIPPRKVVTTDFPQEVRDMHNEPPASSAPAAQPSSNPGIINKPKLIKPRIPAAIPVGNDAARNGSSHHVGKGENVYQIAKRYNVSVENLMKVNGISDPKKLQIGEQLQIPQS